MMKYTGFDIDECDLISDLMPLSTKSVDILACYSVIEHLHDPSNLLTEAKRVLKPDGYFFIETPNWQYSHKSFYDDYTHVKPYTTTSLKSVLCDFGFDVVKLMPNVRDVNHDYIMIVNIVLESQDTCHFVVMAARSVCLRVAQRGYFVLLKFINLIIFPA